MAIPTDNFGGYMICSAYVSARANTQLLPTPARTPEKIRADLHAPCSLDRLRSASQKCQWKNRPAAPEGEIRQRGAGSALDLHLLPLNRERACNPRAAWNTCSTFTGIIDPSAFSEI